MIKESWSSVLFLKRVNFCSHREFFVFEVLADLNGV